MENKIVFALSNCKRLAYQVSDILNIDLGEVEISRFKDGETLTRVVSDVTNKDVFVIQSISKPTNDTLMELLIFINALKNAGAKTINLIVPYMGYARQDRIAKDGEPITSQLVAELISNAGANSFYTFDIHTEKTISYFKIKAKNISSCEIFGNYYLSLLKEKGIDTNDIVVVSPDHGSYNRGQELSKYLPGSSFAIVSKTRPYANASRSYKIDGDVKNKYAIIIDDIIDTAGTIIGAINLLKEGGVKDIFVSATHGIFSIDPDVLINDVSDLVVTDSVSQTHKGVKVLSLAVNIATIVDKLP